MSKWEMVSFGDAIDDVTKKATKIKKEDYLTQGQYYIIDQGKGYLAGYANSPDGLYTDVPAIVFGDHTRIIKYVDRPLFIGADGVKLLKIKSDEFAPKYVYYYLKSCRIIDTGYNRHFKWLKEFDIPQPSLPVQQQIADVLDRASALIEKRKAQIEKLDLLVKSQFIEMFGDPVTNPKGWEIGTIRDLVTDVKYGTSKPAEENGRYVYLRMNNITYGGSIDLSDLKYINVDDKDYEKYIVRKGDVLFNRTNSKELVGKTAVFKGESPMIIAGYIIRVRTNEKAHPEYISAFLNSRYGKSTLLDMCKAIVGQANINAQELQDIKIPLAPISIQNKFADFVHQVESQKSLLQQSLAKLELNYKSLMQKCFRGEVF